MKRLALLLALLCAAPSWATIRLVGQATMPATDDASSSASSATFTAPDGILANDVCLAFFTVRSTTVTITNTTAGEATAWTANTAQVGATNTYRSFYVKMPGPFTSNPVFGWSVANSYAGWLMCFRGVDTTTQVDAAEVTASQAAAATFTNGASFITTSTNNALVIHAFSSVDDNTWNAWTGGTTQPYQVGYWRNANTTGSSLTISYLTQASSGGSASFSATEATLGNDAGTRAAIALKPAAAGAAENNWAKVDDFSIVSGSSSAITKTGYPGRAKLAFGFFSKISGAGAINGLDQGFGILAEGQTLGSWFGIVDNVGFGNSCNVERRTSFFTAWSYANPETVASNDIFEATMATTSDGLTLTPTTSAPANYSAYTWAIGGDDITAAAIAQFSLPTGTGSVTYSNLFPFQPDALIFVQSGVDSTGSFPEINQLSVGEGGLGADTDDSPQFGIGFVDASLNQAATVSAIDSEAVGEECGSSITKTSQAYLEFDPGGGGVPVGFCNNDGTVPAAHTLAFVGNVTAITASGFTMNWTTVDTTRTAGYTRAVVGVKLSANGKLRVYSGTSATTATTVAISTDIGGTALPNLVGVFHASGLSGTGGTARQDLQLSLGAYDGTNVRSIGGWHKEGGGTSGSVPTDNRSFTSTSAIYDERSLNSSSTAVGTATISSLTSGLTYNFSLGGNSNTMFGLAWGPAPAGGGGGTTRFRALMGVGQ